VIAGQIRGERVVVVVVALWTSLPCLVQEGARRLEDSGVGVFSTRGGGAVNGLDPSLGRGQGPSLGLRTVDVDRAERHAFARAIGCGGHVLIWAFSASGVGAMREESGALASALS